MTEIPRAATQLITQVTEHQPDASYEVTDEPDGFGVNREIKWDKDTSKWLAPILEAIEDERIASIEQRGKTKQLVVTFVGDISADDAEPFPFDEVLEVFAEDGADA